MPIQAYEETVPQGIDETTGEPELDKERVPDDSSKDERKIRPDYQF